MTASGIDTPPRPDFDQVFEPTERQQWTELALAGLKKDSTDTQALLQLRRTTLEGIPVDVLYDSAEQVFSPRLTPRHDGWDNRVSISATEPKTAHGQAIAALNGGATSIELHTREPSQLKTILDSVQLSVARVSLRCGAHYTTSHDALVAIAADQHTGADALSADFNADPVGTLLSGETRPDALPAALTDMSAFATHCLAQTPGSSAVLVDTAIHHNAGASTVEELHAAIATATLYLEAMQQAGLSAEQAGRQIIFQCALDADVLLGIAKLRTLRLLWQHVLQQFGVDHRECRVVAETSQRFLSVLEPWNNHLRNLAAATAAAMGGADTLIVHPHDSLLRHQSAESTLSDTVTSDRMARNIGIILDRECGLCKVSDPWRGSYAMEMLCKALMEHTWESLCSTDTGEGWLDELCSGRWQTRLQMTHQQRVQLLQNEQRVAVGVSKFVHITDSTQPTHQSETQSSSVAMLQPVREASVFEQALLTEDL